MEFGGFLEKWREYLNGDAPRTDSHLNQANNEYSEEDLRCATQGFDKSCLLGSGSFGQVYKGTMKDGTEVAIKVLQVPEEGGFEDEVRVLSRFRHPNLVILMGFARHAATGWRSLIYEFCAGGDAAQRISRSRHRKELFSGRERLSAALDAACGLSHLHNMTPRAFHRDIKSQNILLDKNGTAKMADFGLACLSSASQHKVHRVGGTVGYACPEYLRTGLITEGAEVYSFGMVLLELLTGVPPAICRPGGQSGEYNYLVDWLQGSSEKVQQMLDQTASFAPRTAEAMSELAFRCTRLPSTERPLFKQLVEELRNLLSALSEVGRPTEVVSTPVVATSPPSSELTQAFAKGTAVEAPFRGGPLWFQGWVVNHKQNGIAVVRYNDGQEEDVPFTSLRGAPGTSFVAPTPTPVTERGPPSSPPSLPATLIADAGNGLPRTLDPEPRAQVPALPAWQLKSVYAEGVALSALPEVHRAVAAEGSELVMGRMVQAGGFWDALVPEKDLQTRVSRKHFKLSCRMLSLGDGRRQPAFFVSCLSQNGLLVNGRYMGPDVEQRIEHGAQLGLGVETLATSKSQPASMMSVATAAAWRPPAVKPFVVFELEVLDQAQRADPKTIVPVAQQAVVIDRATPLVFPRASGASPCFGGGGQGLPSAGGLPTGTAASLYPFSQSDSMTAPPE